MTSGTNIGLRRFSKLACLSTLFLIFAGGMVTSTGSGLAVPDWPLSYGMLFPPMVGGIFYEHGHRLVAAGVGLLTLGLAVWLGISEKRRWVRYLGIGALGVVVLQGILGGMTVLFLLPTALSVWHGVLAQSFFVLTILIAYSQSEERRKAETGGRDVNRNILILSLFFSLLIYIQLILGALMRHTGSGLAIPDFPKMGGFWIPPFDEKMLWNINGRRFDLHLDPVSMSQVAVHFIHRLSAFFIVAMLGLLNVTCLKQYGKENQILQTVLCLDLLVLLQVGLGAFTVLTGKSALVTTLHVATGAAALGAAVLLVLRLSPVSLAQTKRLFSARLR